MTARLLALAVVLLSAAAATAGPLPWSYYVRFNAPAGFDGILLGTEIKPPETDGGASVAYHIIMDTGTRNYGQVRSGYDPGSNPTSLFSFGYGDWETVETLPAGKTYSPGTFALSWGFTGMNGTTSGTTIGYIGASGVFTSGSGTNRVILDHSERVTVDGQTGMVRFGGVNGEESSRIEMTVTPEDAPKTPEPGHAYPRWGRPRRRAGGVVAAKAGPDGLILLPWLHTRGAKMMTDATRSLPADPVTLPHDPNATLSAETASTTAPPELPPHFALVAEIGRGAMGVVYSAKQLTLGRTVALKMILSGAHASRQEVARFLAEVQAAAAVEHEHVVRVYESGEHRGTPYLAMELVSGGTLADMLNGRPLPPREAAELVAKVAAGVQAAHAAGILHRDLKPGNILLTADGTPKVADFGLAKRPGVSDLTHTGAILGTPGYMAPEQARGQGKAVGPPADVYAIGAVLFACLAGRPPFVGDDPLSVVMQVVNDEPPSVRTVVKGTPHDLETVVAKCLRKDPATRYANAGELADDLRRWLNGRPILARRSGWLERGWKWVRRHRLPLALGAACVLLGITVGVVAMFKTTFFMPATAPPDAGLPKAARDVAEQYLAAATLDPNGPAARKWADPTFDFRANSGATAGEPNRPYYQYTRATLDDLAQVDGDTVTFRGTATALNRRMKPGGRGATDLPTGGSAAFTLKVRVQPHAEAGLVGFEFDDRESRCGGAELPASVREKVIRDVLGCPAEVYEKHTFGEVEEMLGVRSCVLFYTGGPVEFRVAVEETGQETLRTEAMATAREPYTCTEDEGRFCFTIGRDLDKDTLRPRDMLRLCLNGTHTSYLGLPRLWYHWKGATFSQSTLAGGRLSVGEEMPVYILRAAETEPEKGKEPRTVTLRLMAKKVERK